MSEIFLDQRRLVLMFTDVVDSTLLKTKLGDRAYIEKVLGPHDAIFRKLIAEFPGALEIKNTGDGFLAQFALVSDAVNAALKFQAQMRCHPWEMIAPKARVGIHVGEGVVVRGPGEGRIDVQGHAVDMCARVMSLGLGGQILLSRHAYDDGHQYVREHPHVPETGESLQLRWYYQGRYRFKGKEHDPLEVFEVGAIGVTAFTQLADSDKASRVVQWEDRWHSLVTFVLIHKYGSAGLTAIVLIAIAVGVLYRVHLARQSEKHITSSVAVLDLKNNGPESEGWLSNTLTPVISNNLANGAQLIVVPSREVSLAGRELHLSDAENMEPKMLSALRRRLHADYVVSGSYIALGEKSGGQVRVQLRLIDTKSGKILASINTSGTDKDIFNMLGVPSNRLREELGVAPVTDPAQMTDVLASVPADPEAARYYGEGMRKLNTFDTLGAIRSLKKAIAAAPRYPLIHADLAEALSELGYDSDAREQAQEAFDLSADLSPEKRSLVEARYREMTYEWDKALEIYRSLWLRFANQPEFGFRLAAAQTAAGRGQEALKTLEELKRLQSSTDTDPRIEIQKAEAYETLADFRSEHDAATRAVDFARNVTAQLLLARARIMQCWTSLNLGEQKEAMSACQEARQINDSLENRAGSARSVNNIGTVLANQGDIVGARRMYEAALAISQEIGDKNDMQGAMNNIANMLLMQGNLVEAKRFYDKGLILARERGDKVAIANLLSNIGSLYNNEGELRQAEKAYDDAISLAREVGNGVITARVLYNSGMIRTKRGDLAGAMDRYQESMTFRRALYLKSDVAQSQIGVGDILFIKGDRDGAVRSYRQALSVQRQLGEKNNATYTRLCLAEVMLEDGQLTEAEIAFRELVGDFQSQKDDDDEALAQVGLVRALLLENRLADAQKEIRHASELAKKSADVTIRLTVSIIEARLNAASGKYGEASRSLGAARWEANRMGLLGVQFEIRLALGEVAVMSTKEAIGRVMLNDLKEEAAAKGYAIVAQKAKLLLARTNAPLRR